MKTKLAAGILTVSILIILLLAGPAQAFILGLVIDNPEVDKGEQISFEASVEIESGEVLDIDYLILRLNGPQDVECMFNTDGSIISGCLGMSIQLIESPPYNYGYGFEEGFLKFMITLDTGYYYAGRYTTSVEMQIGNDLIVQEGEDILIKTTVDELEGCSIRAKDGGLFVEGKEYERDDVNFHIPLGNANNGKGSVTGQVGRDRFSYKFDIIEILENNDDYANILVSGEYRIGTDKDKAEDAVIYFDKINNRISIAGDSIVLNNADITFRKKC